MNRFIRILIIIVAMASAADVGLLIEGASPVREGASISTVWRMWMVLLWAVLMLSARSPLRYIRPLFPMFPFLAWSIFSFLLNDPSMVAFKVHGSSILGPLVASALAVWIYDHGDTTTLKKGLWMGFFTIIAVAFALGFAGLQTMPGRPVSPYFPCMFLGVGHPLPFIAMCVCLLSVTIGEAYVQPVSWFRFRIVLILIPCVLSLFRTALGGIFAAFVAVIAVTVGPSSLREVSRLNERHTKTVRALAMVVGMGVIASLPILAMKMFNDQGSVNFNGRLEAWPVFLDAARGHYLFGIGPAADILLAAKHGMDTFGAAHSDYLMLFVDFGIFGCILWGAGMIGIAMPTLRAMLRRPLRGSTIASLFSLVALLVTMLTENTLRTPGVTWWYFILPLLEGCIQRGAAAQNALPTREQILSARQRQAISRASATERPASS